MTIVSRNGAILTAYREPTLWSGSPKYIAGVYVPADYEDTSALCKAQRVGEKEIKLFYCSSQFFAWYPLQWLITSAFWSISDPQHQLTVPCNANKQTMNSFFQSDSFKYFSNHF
jgi:hypothetical protein